MSTFPPPPPPPPPPSGAAPWPGPPPPPPAAARPSPVLVALGLLTAVVFLVGAVAVAVRRGEPGVPHPDEWDPRVVELAEWVADARGLDWEHPVHVDFLSPEEYSSEATSSEGDLTDDERDALGHHAGVLRALGVASGELDLFAAYNQVSDGGTLAFYSTADKRIRVRGTEVTVGVEVTLVHELTHALQDQHFDMTRVFDPDLDSSASAAFRGVVEGDAMRIEQAYVDEELTDDERAAYDEQYAEAVETSEAATAGVPAFVSAGFAAPYYLGHPLVIAIVNEGGNAAMDDALQQPPTTEEHLFDPLSFLADDDQVEVDLELDDDLEIRDEGPFGAPSWYLVLAEHLDLHQALEAALGWAGDRYATFDRDGTACIRAAFAGDERADEVQMQAALEAWAATPGGAAVEVMELDGRPGFEACDPGPEVEVPVTDRAIDALLLPSLRAYLAADAVSVVDEDAARCYADRVVAVVTLEDLQDPEGFTGEALQDEMVGAFQACA